MKLVSEEVRAPSSCVAIINGKYRTSWPIVNLLKRGLDDVQNDRYSVLIVGPNHALVSVSGVRNHNSVFFARKLSGLVVALESLNLRLFQGNVLVTLLDSHLHVSVLYNLFALIEF